MLVDQAPQSVAVSEIQADDLILFGDEVRRVESVTTSHIEGMIAVTLAFNPETDKGRVFHSRPDREVVRISEISDEPIEVYTLKHGGSALYVSESNEHEVWHTECAQFHRPEAAPFDLTSYVGIALGKCALCAETVRF